MITLPVPAGSMLRVSASLSQLISRSHSVMPAGSTSKESIRSLSSRRASSSSGVQGMVIDQLPVGAGELVDPGTDRVGRDWVAAAAGKCPGVLATVRAGLAVRVGPVVRSVLDSEER